MISELSEYLTDAKCITLEEQMMSRSQDDEYYDDSPWIPLIPREGGAVVATLIPIGVLVGVFFLSDISWRVWLSIPISVLFISFVSSVFRVFEGMEPIMEENRHKGSPRRQVRCKYCGFQLKPKFRFCPYCGDSLTT